MCECVCIYACGSQQGEKVKANEQYELEDISSTVVCVCVCVCVSDYKVTMETTFSTYAKNGVDTQTGAYLTGE